jgi:hypothetical protein
LLPLGQCSFPVLFQLPDDQAVFRFGELVLAAGPAGGEIRAFQPLPPDPVDLLALGPGLIGRGQGDLQRGGRHRGEQQLGDVRVHARASELLALPGSVVALLTGAHIDRLLPPTGSPLVADGHFLAAASASDQPGQQG